MKIGIIGLGRMGSNMARRLAQGGHECVIFDKDPRVVEELKGKGMLPAASLEALVKELPRPRAVWLMVPASIVGKSIQALAPLLEADDAIIDGGNSHYQDDIRRARDLAKNGIRYLDVGTSGGVWGAERGYCLMIGGEATSVERLDPIFSTLAPGIDEAPRTIEYGIMAAYAEGLNILRHANAGSEDVAADAETTPVRNPEYYRYRFDLASIAEVWRRGSVIGSWLLDLTASALLEDPNLERFAGRVSDSGEGRWTLIAAIDEGVPAPILNAALTQRFASRGDDVFADKVLSALRHQFGGHVEKHP